MAEQRATAAGGLPVVAEPGGPVLHEVSGVRDRPSLRSWLTEHRTAVRETLLVHGHLLLRGLPIEEQADFALARDVLTERRAAHAREETTPRSDLGDGIFSATDLPRQHTIGLHQEDSYSLLAPGLLLFACLVPADTGGATTLGDVRTVLDAVPAELMDRLRGQGWQITRTFSEHVGIGWQQAFGTTDRESVERFCAENLIGCEWLADGRLRTTGLRSATLHHPVTGAECWFNHIAVFNEHTYEPELREVLLDAGGADALPQNTFHGDGTPFDPEEIALLNRAFDAALIRVDWRPGDLLLVDNLLNAHGREPFGGHRRVLVALGDSFDVRDRRPTGPVGPRGLT
ncbi:TauD/TfdA family dioxygenase [Streptomyces sp. NPDC006435]|uniref:TauD/TfdA family dioxygenase n=1 Tax=Streptomyces sp. NPDC006435 TaxID=3154300 RepID=UPI00339FF671